MEYYTAERKMEVQSCFVSSTVAVASAGKAIATGATTSLLTPSIFTHTIFFLARLCLPVLSPVAPSQSSHCALVLPSVDLTVV